MSGAVAAPSRRGRVIGLVVTALVLVLVTPPLVSVYSEAGAAVRLPVRWIVVIVGAAVLQYASTWMLHRIVLRTDRWLDVAAPELIGNAASRLLPAGSATGASVQVRLLTDAGFPFTSAVTSLGAAAVLSTAAGFVVLPLLVLVATAAGSDVDSALLAAMWIGAAVLALLLGVIVVVARRDGAWRRAAAAAAWFDERRHRPIDRIALERRVLAERDLVVEALRRRGVVVAIVVVARPLFDYLSLLAALHAAGASINPAAALAAFVVANVAGMIPLTPGGLGFVEAGLAATITLAGAADGPARVAVATYRLLETWLPCLIGVVAYPLFRRRHPRRARPAAALVDSPEISSEMSIGGDPDRPAHVPGGPARREE